jgi:hypothetical protein
MFNKIKEFFTGKPAVETTTQEVPLTAADVAIKNIKETTAAVDAKVEVAPVVTPVAEATPAPAVKEQAWTKNPPAAIAQRAPRKQPVKATTAPKKKKPAAKS